jgi:4-amino-4-deoxychorismate lyase
VSVPFCHTPTKTILLGGSILLPTILINGQVAEQISVLDRGFQYGDGLFETIRVRDGRPCHWRRHMSRLAVGCKKLRIPAAESALLLSEAMSLCADKPDAVLKIIITRGRGERGYAPPTNGELTRVLLLLPTPAYPPSHARDGVVVRICDTRLASNPALAGIKHLNRLEQVLARGEWEDTHIAEGLMLDQNQKVIEGTMSNLFCVQESDGQTLLKTPQLEQCGVKGITRERIMAAARTEAITVQEVELEMGDLYRSQELFLCNTLMGIWPVRQLEDHHFSVGPIARRLSAALESRDD